MFTRPTVIVLGAGASHQFGFPLGGELVDDIKVKIRHFISEAEERVFGMRPIGADNATDFHKKPIESLVAYLQSPLSKPFLPNELRANHVRAFLEDLEGQDFDTIDSFIRNNPDHADVGKLLLAQFILVQMYELRPGYHTLTPKSFSDSQYTGSRNWYRKLLGLIRDDTDNVEGLAQNRLTMLTFNYDLSLELYLEAMLPRTQNHAGADYRDVLPILHLNGAPNHDDLPKQMTDVGRFILTSAQTIHVVDESASSDVQNLRSKAFDALQNAERIYVIGFHFDPSNIEVLKLGQLEHPDRIFCLNFDGNAGVRQTILNLGIPPNNIRSGSDRKDDGMYVDRALYNGFLEQ